MKETDFTRNGAFRYGALVVFLCDLGAVLALSNCVVGLSPTSRPASGETQSSPTTLSSISLSPLDPSTDVGGAQQFFASAIYSDKSTQDITKLASWSSSDPTTATIGSTGQAHPGLAAAVAIGSATITATYGGKSGSTALTVASNAAMLPLMDMTTAQNYLSFQGGLYENSSDTVPADHSTAGLAAASAVQPRDANGNPSLSGKVVFVAIGRSEAQEEFTVFISQAAANSQVNHTTLVIANGAQDAALPCVWAVASGPPPCEPTLGNQYDRVRDTVLAPLNVTEQQVQAAWIEEYDTDPGGDGFQAFCDPTTAGCSNDPGHTEAFYFEKQLGGILRAARARWPNLQQVFLSSRIYAGYATTNHISEPYAYEYGFSVKWVVQAQVLQVRSGGTQIDPTAGDLNYTNGTAPWIAWGPYLWADADTPRSDGLVWCNGQSSSPCNGEVDFQADGVHPNTQGDQKVTNLLMNFFLNSPFTPWFRP